MKNTYLMHQEHSVLKEKVNICWSRKNVLFRNTVTEESELDLTVETHLKIHEEREGQLMEKFLNKDRHEEGILAAQMP